MSYTIKSGDTLSAIAKRNNTTAAALMRLNPQITNPNMINAGGLLNLPADSVDEVMALPPGPALLALPAAISKANIIINSEFYSPDGTPSNCEVEKPVQPCPLSKFAALILKGDENSTEKRKDGNWEFILPNIDLKIDGDGRKDAKYDLGNLKKGGEKVGLGDKISYGASLKILGRKYKNEDLYFGSDDNHIRVGAVDAEGLLGIDYDASTDVFKAGAFFSAEYAAVKAEGKLKFVKGAVDVKGEFVAGSLKGNAEFGYVKSEDFHGVEGTLGASATLAKVTGSFQVNITPQTIYDNTVGSVVTFFKPKSKFASIGGIFKPDTTMGKIVDHGLVIGAGGEAGIGAAIKADIKFGKNKDGVLGLSSGATLGAGPMAGFKLFFGVK